MFAYILHVNEKIPFSDERLAEKAKKDVDVFGELVERYEKPLLRYIVRISSFTKEEAEEILQEIFIKAWTNLNDFDASQKFSSWIYRIAHNQTISEFRKAKSRGSEQKMEWNEEIFGNIAGKTNIEAEIGEKMDGKKMRKGVADLPEKYKSAIVLRFWEEKSYKEMSDILHIPIGSAATLVSRAKKELKKSLERISFSKET